MTRYVITGAPGTGKSGLLASLAERGIAVVGEPARELIAEHHAATGETSLDHRPQLFVDRLVERSIEKFDAASADVVVYDRGLPDCVAYAGVMGASSAAARAAARVRRYADPVVIAPPWEAIYHVDDMRRASFEQVEAFHGAIMDAYAALGYQFVELPKVSKAERTAFAAEVLDL